MIEKKISPKGKTVRVTFSLPADAVTETAAVVGDFNDWNVEKGVMKLNAKTGVYTKGVSLKPGSSHQFRYVVDSKNWRNDEQADAFVPNDYFGENGVVNV